MLESKMNLVVVVSVSSVAAKIVITPLLSASARSLAFSTAEKIISFTASTTLTRLAPLFGAKNRFNCYFQSSNCLLLLVNDRFIDTFHIRYILYVHMIHIYMLDTIQWILSTWCPTLRYIHTYICTLRISKKKGSTYGV